MILTALLFVGFAAAPVTATPVVAPASASAPVHVDG
jgi:hypothetical protein